MDTWKLEAQARKAYKKALHDNVEGYEVQSAHNTLILGL
jgi:hypothetical protein